MISELPEEQQLTAGRLTKNSIWSVLGWAAIFGLSFISTPILVRMLGKDNYGLMTLLYTVLTPLGVLDFGVSEATVKYVSESLGRGDLHQVEKYISSTMVFNLGIGLLGLTTIALLADLLSTRVFNIPPDSQATARMCWYLIGASWFFMQTRQTFIGAVSAAQRYDILNIGNFLFQGIYILAGLSVLFLRGNLLNLVWAQTFVGFFAVFAWFLAARRLYPGLRFLPRFEKEAFRRTFGYGFWQMLNNLGGILSNQTQRWILGILLPIATVGFYNISIQLLGVIYQIAYRMGQVMFPTVSHMQGQGRDEEAARLTVHTSWLISTIAISGLVSLFVFANDFLRLWIGPEIATKAAPVIQILCLASAMGCLFAVPNFYLLGTGRVKWLAAMSFVQGGVVLALCSLLIPRFGLIGAAWAGTISHGVHLFVLIWMWHKIYRPWIRGKVYFSATFGQYLGGVLMAIAFTSLRSLFAGSLGWLQLILSSMVCSTISLCILLLIGVLLPGGRERRDLAMSMAGSLFKKKLLPDPATN